MLGLRTKVSQQSFTLLRAKSPQPADKCHGWQMPQETSLEAGSLVVHSWETRGRRDSAGQELRQRRTPEGYGFSVTWHSKNLTGPHVQLLFLHSFLALSRLSKNTIPHITPLLTSHKLPLYKHVLNTFCSHQIGYKLLGGCTKEKSGFSTWTEMGSDQDQHYCALPWCEHQNWMVMHHTTWTHQGTTRHSTK